MNDLRQLEPLTKPWFKEATRRVLKIWADCLLVRPFPVGMLLWFIFVPLLSVIYVLGVIKHSLFYLVLR